MPAIKAILLDADGVVQLPRGDWKAAVGALCADPARAAEFCADVFAAEWPCLIGAEDFTVALGQVLKRWRSEVPVEDALRVWTQIEPNTAILELVQLVRTCGVAVALATNQQAYRADFMTHSLGYAAKFDQFLYSHQVGCCKPSPEYFTAALTTVAVDPSMVLFIDDHAANVAAARACGMHAQVFHATEGARRLREILQEHGLTLGARRIKDMRHSHLMR